MSLEMYNDSANDTRDAWIVQKTPIFIIREMQNMPGGLQDCKDW